MSQWITLVAILVIGTIETIALCKGMNGVMLSLSVGAIAGLGGYTVKTHIDKIKGGKQ